MGSKRGCECNGDVTSTILPSRGCRGGYNVVVWQNFHILNRGQVFVVTSVCAVAIALAVGLASIPADGTSMNRFLAPSRQFDPLINFGSVFVSVLPAWRFSSVVLQEALYLGACLLLSVLVLAVHMKASNSRAILDTQRLLNLFPDLQRH